MISRYMSARMLPQLLGSKTKVWDILNKRSGANLGRVRWFGPWRQYCFFTEETSPAIFSAGCLGELRAFMEAQNATQ